MPGRRVFVGVRLGPAFLALVDRVAEGEGRTRSGMLRALLTEALTARGLLREPAGVDPEPEAAGRLAARIATGRPGPAVRPQAAADAEAARQERIERMRRNQGRGI